MTQLNIKQKKLLKEYFVKELKGSVPTYTPADHLPYELYEELERINDHETLNQNINRFLLDLED